MQVEDTIKALDKLKKATVVDPVSIGLAADEVNTARLAQDAFTNLGNAIRAEQEKLKSQLDSAPPPPIVDPDKIDNLLLLVIGKINKRFDIVKIP